MVRQYAKYMGIAIVLIGVVGLLLGEQSLLGVLNIDLGEDIVHLATGGLMAYAGFQMRDSAAVRMVVGGLGIVYLLVVVLGVLSPTLFGLLPSGYTAVDHLIHAALGAAGIAFGYFLKGATTSAPLRADRIAAATRGRHPHPCPGHWAIVEEDRPPPSTQSPTT